MGHKNKEPSMMSHIRKSEENWNDLCISPYIWKYKWKEEGIIPKNSSYATQPTMPLKHESIWLLFFFGTYLINVSQIKERSSSSWIGNLVRMLPLLEI